MEKSEELFLLRSLLNSKSNIYVHGANGTGKTTFVQDVIKTHNSINGDFLVYVDCIEFNSEKLIAACISQQLNSVVQSALKKLSHRYLFANEHALLRLSVRPSRNLDGLLEALNKFTESIDEFRARER
jgi:Cdc6-like AAA superfamily ATPase